MLTSIVSFWVSLKKKKKKVVKKNAERDKKLPKAAQKSEKLSENVLLTSEPYCAR